MPASTLDAMADLQGRLEAVGLTVSRAHALRMLAALGAERLDVALRELATGLR